jgi:hypothetical protein
MLNREFAIAVLADHCDEDEGGPTDQAHAAVVAQLGWRAFSDEALSLMATEVIRQSGLLPLTAQDEDIFTTARRRH